MIDKHMIDEEIRAAMGRPMTRDNIRLLAELKQARECVGGICDELSDEEARAWAAAMSPGAKWSQDQTTAVMRQRGYDDKPRDFHLAMNAMYSDYGKVLAKHNMDKPEVYADLAEAFLHDPDARKGKLARYWREIVEH